VAEEVAGSQEVPYCLRHLVSKQAYGVIGVPLPQGRANSVRAKVNLVSSAQLQRKTKVLMRLGTSPAGITAMDFSVLVSMAETERAAEFDT